MNLDNLGKKLYCLTVLDPLEGRENEAENLIKPFVENGYRQFNILLFTSPETLENINNHIAEKKSEKFVYFLIDVTNHVDSNVFKGYLNKRYYVHSEQVAKLIRDFRTDLPKEELTPKEIGTKIDSILDKIARDGIKSLSLEEKEFLDIHTNSKHK